jgi:hypothetical protein
MPESKTSENRLEAAEKQRQALELRKVGKTFEYIAKKVGYRGVSGAYNAVMAGLKATLQEPADEVRVLELSRLDVMLERQLEAAERGVPQAVDRVLRIMERRARYLGLDAPVKQEVFGKDGGDILLRVTYDNSSAEQTDPDA